MFPRRQTFLGEGGRPPIRMLRTVRGGEPTGDRSLALLKRLGTNAVSAAIFWLVTRAAALAVMTVRYPNLDLDVRYYADNVAAVASGHQHLGDTLREYPLPVVWLLWPFHLIAGDSQGRFVAAFLVAMLVLDAAFAVALRGWSGGEGAAVTFWLFFVPAIGPVAYFRFDLIPAVLVGLACLLVIRRPVWSGVALGLGAVLKLWPGLGWVLLSVRRDGSRRLTAGFAGVSLVIIGVCVLSGGLDRLFSPVRWQLDRGLQIESVAATPLMVADAVSSGRWTTRLSDYNAWEIFGPGVSLMTALASLVGVASLIVLGALWLRVRRAEASAALLCWLMLAGVALVLVADKTLSAQYLLWLGGPMAALLVVSPGDRAARRYALLLVVIAGVTQCVFPGVYSWVTAARVPAVALLVVRNALLLWLAVGVTRTAWLRSRPAGSRETTTEIAVRQPGK
jgi:hypothetical protein